MAPRVLVVGESLVDVVIAASGETIDTTPGGSPLNIAVGLARLDIPTLLLTTFGDDEYGRLVTKHAASSAVGLLHESPTSQPTSVARAVLDETNQASYEFELHWDPPATDLPAGVSVMHVGSLGTAVAPGDATVFALAEQAVEAGVPVTYDPNVRPAISTDPDVAWEGVRRWADVADVVKMSDDDARYVRSGVGVDDMLDELLSGPRTRLAVITRGADGTVLATRRHRVHVGTPSVRVVDTVGAGDSFMAALIAAVLDRDLLDDDALASVTEAQLAEIGGWAVRVAAITCGRRGADPPRRAELT
jgi:fructokinase